MLTEGVSTKAGHVGYVTSLKISDRIDMNLTRLHSCIQRQPGPKGIRNATQAERLKEGVINAYGLERRQGAT